MAICASLSVADVYPHGCMCPLASVHIIASIGAGSRNRTHPSGVRNRRSTTKPYQHIKPSIINNLHGIRRFTCLGGPHRLQAVPVFSAGAFPFCKFVPSYGVPLAAGAATAPAAGMTYTDCPALFHPHIHRYLLRRLHIPAPLFEKSRCRIFTGAVCFIPALARNRRGALY